MRKFLLTALVAVMPMTASGTSYLAPNKLLQVNRVSDTTFEVIEDASSNRQIYWCTAGRYVTDVLRRYQSRIYIARARGPSQTMPGRRAVLFSTVPVGDEPHTPTLTTSKVGAHEGSGYSVRLCEQVAQSRSNR